MTFLSKADNASSTISNSGGISNSATSVSIQSGDVAAFPASGNFVVTLWPANTNPTKANCEKVLVTAGQGTQNFTITRGYGGTTPLAFNQNDNIALLGISEFWTDIEMQVNTNTGDIATNTSDISTNTTNIATNTSDITTNATNISNLQSQHNAKGRAIIATAAQSIPSATWTKALIDTISYDPGSNFDVTTNHRFTVPVTGYYLVSAAVLWSQFSANSDCWTGIYVNGVEATAIEYGVIPTPIRTGQVITDILYLTATDYVELWCFQNSGAAHSLTYHSPDWNFLTVHLLSL